MSEPVVWQCRNPRREGLLASTALRGVCLPYSRPDCACGWPCCAGHAMSATDKRRKKTVLVDRGGKQRLVSWQPVGLLTVAPVAYVASAPIYDEVSEFSAEDWRKMAKILRQGNRYAETS